MLFSFFKKNRTQPMVVEHLDKFQESFTENQKKAILQQLLILANVDGEYHRNEERFFQAAAQTLVYQLNDFSLTEIILMTSEDAFKILKTLNDQQKDWFIITIYGMLSIDGKGKDVEFNNIAFVLNEMGVSSQRVDRVLNKFNAIVGKLN